MPLRNSFLLYLQQLYLTDILSKAASVNSEALGAQPALRKRNIYCASDPVPFDGKALANLPSASPRRPEEPPLHDMSKDFGFIDQRGPKVLGLVVYGS